MQFRPTARYEPRARFGACPLADFAFCQPTGQISFICLVNRELHQNSMAGLLKGMQISMPSCYITHCTDICISSFRAANTGSLDVQLWIHAPLCAGRVARTPRRAARSFWRSDHAKDHADMRLTCGSHVVGEGVVASATAFRSPRAAENQFRAPAWTGHASSSEIREFR
jgi:hypothetical protein